MNDVSTFNKLCGKKNDPVSSILIRSAITDKNGIVNSDRFIKIIGAEARNIDLADWADNWSNAEAKRIWPPEF